MRLELRTLVERATRWLVTNRRPPLDSEGIVDFFDPVSGRVLAALPELLTGRELEAYEHRRKELVGADVPEVSICPRSTSPWSAVMNAGRSARSHSRSGPV